MSTRSSDRLADSRPTRARIDLAALAENWAIARRHAGARTVIAVVKADAYGHGAPAVARRLLREISECSRRSRKADRSGAR